MTFRNCPVKARIGCKNCRRQGYLTDRKGVKFPIRCPEYKKNQGESELLNSVPLYLADRIDELKGFKFITLWFNDESREQCAAVAAEYKNGSKKSPEAFTRGLYYRKVL